MMNDKLNYWLETITQWQKQDLQPKWICQQTERMEDLASFLHDLKFALYDTGSVEEILSIFPQIGQLLGRLTTIPTVICDVQVYKPLMTCLLIFFVDRPSTDVEIRAKSWVVSQVRSTISVSRAMKTNPMRGIPGFNQAKINLDCISKVIETMDHHLSTGLASATNADLEDICRICLHFSCIPQFSHILQKVITHLGNEASGHRHGVLKMITDNYLDTMFEVEESRPRIPYSCVLGLWKSYLPSLEVSMLKLCDHYLSSHMMSVIDFDELMFSSHLVQACIDDVLIYQCIFTIIKSMRETTKCSFLDRISSALHLTIRKKFVRSESKAFHIVKQWYPDEYQALLTAMAIPPTELTAPACEKQLEKINSLINTFLPILDETSGDGARSAYMLDIFVLYKDWFDAALMLVLFGSQKIITSCCNILMFHETKAMSNYENQKDHQYLRRVVRALRPLMIKSDMEWNIIQCSISSFDESSHNIGALLGKLLLLYSTHSIAGHSVVHEVMEKVLHCSDVRSKARFFVDTLALAEIFWDTKLNLVPMRITQLLQVIDDLAIDLNQSVDVMDIEGEEEERDAEHVKELRNKLFKYKGRLQSILK